MRGRDRSSVKLLSFGRTCPRGACPSAQWSSSMSSNDFFELIVEQSLDNHFHYSLKNSLLNCFIKAFKFSCPDRISQRSSEHIAIFVVKIFPKEWFSEKKWRVVSHHFLQFVEQMLIFLGRVCFTSCRARWRWRPRCCESESQKTVFRLSSLVLCPSSHAQLWTDSGCRFSARLARCRLFHWTSAIWTLQCGVNFAVGEECAQEWSSQYFASFVGVWNSLIWRCAIVIAEFRDLIVKVIVVLVSGTLTA